MNDNVDDIIHEIKEDVQLDQIINFFKKYARWIISALFISIILSIGYGLWHYFHQKKQQADAHLFDQALQASELNHPLEASTLLEQLKKEGSAGYRLLAAFRQVMSSSVSQDEKIILYNDIIQDEKIEKKFRELATILWGYESIDRASPHILEQRLVPMSQENGPWKYTAIELLALFEIRQGHKEKARNYLHLLMTKPDVVKGLKVRAFALYETLNF